MFAMRLFALPSAILALLPTLCLYPLVRADVEFTGPVANANVDVGTIDVQWKESGIAPPITSLTAYSLLLMTGGDEEYNMLALTTFVSQGNFQAGNSASGTIPAGIAENATNGFFFKMISAKAVGGTVINYSDRFSINGLTGFTAPVYLNAINALDGSTKAPDSVGDAVSSSVVSTKTAGFSATAGLPTTRVVSGSPTRSSTSTTSNTSNNRSGGGHVLSNGALAGIAIACAVFGLISLGVALWVCLRRRKQKESIAMKLDELENNSDDSLRREMSMGTSIQTPVELDPSAKIVEADNGLQRPEMDSMNVRAELEGDAIHPYHFETPLTPVPDTPLDCLTLDSIRIPTPTTPGFPVLPRNNV